MKNSETQGLGGSPDLVRAEYLVGMAVILAALLVSIALFFGMNGISQGVSKLDRGLAASLASAAAQGSGAQPAGPLPALEGEITIDYLYSDSCPHCQKMMPIMKKLDSLFPDGRFVVRYWSEADAKKGGDAAKVFAEYQKQGVFPGYPTFVMNNGEKSTAGEMSESAILAWICEEFGSPKPSGC